MKKIILFLAFTLGLVSCEDDAQFNDPAFQAQINYRFWQAKGAVAEVHNGTLQIYANDGVESLTMRIPNFQLGQRYEFGLNDTVVGVYRKIVDKDTLRFKSGKNVGSGYVVLDAAEHQKPGTLSGTFVVEMKNTENLDLPNVKFHEGVFYRIPIRTVEEE